MSGRMCLGADPIGSATGAEPRRGRVGDRLLERRSRLRALHPADIRRPRLAQDLHGASDVARRELGVAVDPHHDRRRPRPDRRVQSARCLPRRVVDDDQVVGIAGHPSSDRLGAVVARPDAENDPQPAGVGLGSHRRKSRRQVQCLVADRHHDVDIGPRPGRHASRSTRRGVHPLQTRRDSTTQTVRSRICTSVTSDQLTRYWMSYPSLNSASVPYRPSTWANPVNPGGSSLRRT